MKSILADIYNEEIDSNTFLYYSKKENPILSKPRRIWLYIGKYVLSTLDLSLAGINLYIGHNAIGSDTTLSYVCALFCIFCAFLLYRSNKISLSYTKIADGLLNYQYLIDRYSLGEYLKYLLNMRHDLNKHVDDMKSCPYYLINEAYRKFNMKSLYDTYRDKISKLQFTEEFILIVKIFIIEYYYYDIGEHEILENMNSLQIIKNCNIDLLLNDLKKNPKVIKKIKDDLFDTKKSDSDNCDFENWLNKLFQ